MRTWILAALIATAPAIAQAQGPAADAKGKEQPQSVWRPWSGGEFEHLQSGLRCPAAVDGYQRYGVTTYDGFGLDISCGWNAPHTALTLYLTRGVQMGPGMADAIKGLEQQGAARHPRQLSDGHVQMGGLDWRKVAYAEDGDLRSDIWLTDVGGWAVEYRATYPATDEKAVATELETLTGLMRRTAGRRLELCAKAGAPPARTGKRITDQKELADVAMTGALLWGAAQAAADDKGKPGAPDLAPKPVAWCVEAALKLGDAPVLTWRGIKADGADALADRLSMMTMGPPPSLDIQADTLGDIVAKETFGKTPGRWIATLQSGGKFDIFGYFQGRPSTAVAAPLFADILNGRAGSLGGYSANGKTINVVTPK
jgi:hypothetical protein